MYLVEKTQG